MIKAINEKFINNLNLKKVIAILLCIVMIFNFITVKSLAEEPAVTTPPEKEERPITPSEEVVNKKEPPLLEEFSKDIGVKDNYNGNLGTGMDIGNVDAQNDNQENVKLSTTGNSFTDPFTFKVLVQVLALVPQIASQMMELVVEQASDKSISKFTIYDTVIGKYELFNIDFMDVPDKIDEDSLGYEIIRYCVVKAYTQLRNASIALSLFVLIYIGIRMAISTLAEDKAKYKSMLLNWFISLILVFFMHYIIIIISYLLSLGLDIVERLAFFLHINDIEEDIYNVAVRSIGGGATKVTGVFTPAVKGWNSAVALITIWIIVYYEVRFFIMYVQRMFEINFLVVISPLVTVTYSIDKAGDNKAQAFSAWFSELSLKASVQIVHAVTYCIFIASAGVIAQNHPLLAAVFLSLLLRVEKIVRNTLSLKDNSLHNVKIPFIKQ